MSVASWNWLPESALASPLLLQHIDSALEVWNSRWFKTGRLVRHRLEFTAPPTTPDVVSATSRVSIRMSAAAVETLTGRALDMDLAQLELSEPDHATVSSFSEAILQDLAQVLDTALAGDETMTTQGDMSPPASISLTDEEGRKIAVIETSRAVLTQARLSLAPAPRPAASALSTPLAKAIADVPVTLAVDLGSATIPLPEALKLAPGDVIVLDRKLDETFDIMSSGDPIPVACATLADTASPHSLRLVAAAATGPK